MLIMNMYRCVPEEQRPVDFAQLELPEKYKPLLRPTLECQAGILGLATQDVRGPVRQRDLRTATFAAVEVFTDGSSLFVLSFRDRGRVAARRLIAGREEPGTFLSLAYIGSPANAATVHELLEFLGSNHGLRFDPYYYTSDRFDELKAEGRESTSVPSADELAAVEVLRDKTVRTLVTAIKTSGGLLVRDLSRQIPQDVRGRTEALRSDLEAARLIEVEVVVICGKSQTQTARLPRREVLADIAAQGVRCACGRPIGEERVEEALTVTDFGRLLLDKSRWLTLLVVQHLVQLGVPAEHILIEQQMGGDEVDCIANVSGELVLFELKDKEFNLGNAYSLGAKIGILRPARAVIVSTEHVGGDAKDHFQRARVAQSSARYIGGGEPATDIEYIEGIEKLDVSISLRYPGGKAT